MADDGQMSVWLMAGTAIGGIITGIGSVFGVNKVRGKSGDERLGELEQVKQQVAALQVTAGQSVAYQETLNRVDRSLNRLHERMEALEKSVSRLEGYEAGRRSREHDRGED